MRKVYLCAGHRGGNTGANANDFKEAEETIYIRDAVAKRLIEKGVEVILDDNDAQLNDVVKTINKTCEPADICIDFHFNCFGNPTVNGSEVLKPFNYSLTEVELAEDMLYATTYILETKDRGIKNEGEGQYNKLAMLSGIKCNSIVLEICFISNKEDLQKYLDKKEDLIIMYAETLLQYANS